ncbi:hypothetical protein C8A03DRAFT_28888 [Achaetomium macrosporum]|uniref:Cyanovirin-N domain-containing protein n=1 Tax=Achaetomium macrosporum TaxID=79813 RepID=A0AAN7CJE7_9PEZI|nr:hypothetical protein C8A03DRAFT_28888 [Achaetomium macrosporum]
MIMTNLFTLLTAAAVAAAAVLPALSPNSSVLAVRDLSPRQDLEGGFAKHCYTYSVGERGEIYGRLSGSCDDDEFFGDLHNMWLDLNQCLGNDNGDLIWQDGGNAIAKSCKNCHSRRDETQWIECECKDRKGAYQKLTSLDLNVGVRYDMDNHVLACFGHLGVRE